MTGPQDGPEGSEPRYGAPDPGNGPTEPQSYPPLGQPPSYPPPYQGQPPQSFPPPYGQNPYGQNPYGQNPYGQNPYGQNPAGQFPGGPPPWGAPVPPRKRSWLKWVVVASVISVVLLIAVVIAGIVVQSHEINDIDDATTGSCITVSGTSSEATPHRADCGSDDFSFYIGQKVDENAQCADEFALHLTQRGKGRLCLTPNLREGKCYSLPGQSGSVTDFAEVDCSATDLAFSKTVIKVAQRVESSASDVCTAGEQLSYRRPNPVTYCADVLTSG
ncbi:LppU/SCO3897 family protein [Williamsia deligens]|uniref:Uncharacterized protein n=1 Tax=Williamsia deligens TaxID=321325 RepID=A0ABW3G7E1_9NOCA|nr:hypothetical protein [Williamsia deligens]MCP2192849.1 hypothetical protein [Williamsia deligens]